MMACACSSVINGFFSLAMGSDILSLLCAPRALPSMPRPGVFEGSNPPKAKFYARLGIIIHLPARQGKGGQAGVSRLWGGGRRGLRPAGHAPWPGPGLQPGGGLAGNRGGRFGGVCQPELVQRGQAAGMHAVLQRAHRPAVGRGYRNTQASVQAQGLDRRAPVKPSSGTIVTAHPACGPPSRPHRPSSPGRNSRAPG